MKRFGKGEIEGESPPKAAKRQDERPRRARREASLKGPAEANKNVEDERDDKGDEPSEKTVDKNKEADKLESLDKDSPIESTCHQDIAQNRQSRKRKNVTSSQLLIEEHESEKEPSKV